MNATRLIWEGAGRPADTTGETGGVVDVVAYTGPCWWCGQLATGLGRPRGVLPETFPWPLQAAAPEGTHLCLPCGWTLCDRVELPGYVAGPRLTAKADRGCRQVLADGRYLLLRLADGLIGRWSVAPRAVDEDLWHEAVGNLRTNPCDVGVCKYLGAVPESSLTAGPVEKFRAYHHFATASRWWPCTDTDRMEIRAWLLNPPAEPWVGVIGEGKKHHAIKATLMDAVSNPAGHGVQSVYHLESVIHYLSSDLARWIDAAERLIRAGAGDDEITSGHYYRLSDIVALRRAEPVIAEVRGGPTLALVLYLRRNRKELADV